MPQTVVQIMLRMPPDLHGHLASLAKAQGTSLNSLIVELIRQAADRRQGDGEADGKK